MPSRHRTILAIAALGAVLIFICAPLASAAVEEGWIISDFASRIEVQEDGRIAVEETIQVDFQGLSRHGIYRDMPYAYRDRGGSMKYTAVEVVGVEEGGTEAQYEVTRNESNLRIRIGDPDRTVSGPHVYVVRYTVSGSLMAFETYDELYWNITGNDWAVPIQKSSAEVRLPPRTDGTLILQASCYVGPRGINAPCSSGTASDGLNTIRFAHDEPLPPESGFTIAVGYRKGLVPILTVSKLEALGVEPLGVPIAFGSAALVFVLGAVFIIRRWWKYGRDRWFPRGSSHDVDPDASAGAGETMPLGAHETIVVEYDPPSHAATEGGGRGTPLRPAEVGILKDETADTLDISATIVDLAVRGYLSITEIPKKWRFGKTDYELKRMKPVDTALLSYERELFEGLFDAGDIIQISALREKFYTKLSKIKKLLYEHAVQKGFFTRDPDKVRTINLWIAIAMIVPGPSFAFTRFINSHLLFTNVMDAALTGAMTGLFLAGCIQSIVAWKAMPQRTAVGRELYRQIRGYELYLKNVEKHRQQFFEREGTFMQVLPYVIVFGLTKRIASAMAAMGMKPPQPAWYAGNYAAFSIASFSDSVSSFSDSLSSAIASAPGGSGSGGGGFSGGGGGGGGGGSW